MLNPDHLDKQPLMTAFVVMGAKLERVPQPLSVNPFDDEPAPQRTAAVTDRAPHDDALHALTFIQKLTVCRMDEQYTRERVIAWAIKKYKCGKSSLLKILAKGAGFFQNLVNGGHGDEYRIKGPTSYGEALLAVDKELREDHDDNFGITKCQVIKKIQEKTGLQSALALEDRYHFFMRFYGWGWRRYSRCSPRLAPRDMDAKIKNWSMTLFSMNRARHYVYGVCLDETSLLEEGSSSGMVICPRGSKAQVKVAANDEKKSVTVLFGSVVEFATGRVKPLPPLVVFESKAAGGRATSQVYAEVMRASHKLGLKIVADVSDSGWVKQDVYPRYINAILPIGGSNGPRAATILIDDSYKGHIDLVDMPVNVDRHQIPGGGTKDIQVADLFENARFSSDFDKAYMANRAAAKTHDPMGREELLEFVYHVHTGVWAKYEIPLTAVHRKFVIEPATVAGWVKPDHQDKRPHGSNRKCEVRKKTKCAQSAIDVSNGVVLPIVTSVPFQGEVAVAGEYQAKKRPKEGGVTSAAKVPKTAGGEGDPPKKPQQPTKPLEMRKVKKLAAKKTQEEISWDSRRREGTMLSCWVIDLYVAPFVSGYPSVVYLSSSFCALWGNDLVPEFPNNVSPDADKVVCAVMFYSSHFSLVVVTGLAAVVFDSYSHYAVALRDAMVEQFLHRLAEHRQTQDPFVRSVAQVPQQLQKENTCAIHVVNNIVRTCLGLAANPSTFENELTRKTLTPVWKPIIAPAAVRAPAAVAPGGSVPVKFPMKAPAKASKKDVPILSSSSDSDSSSDTDSSDEEEEEGEDAAESPPPPPPPPPPTRAKQAGGKIEQLWVCAVCTIKNDVKVKKCTMCGAYKAVVLEKFIDEAGSGARKER